MRKRPPSRISCILQALLTFSYYHFPQSFVALGVGKNCEGKGHPFLFPFNFILSSALRNPVIFSEQSTVTLMGKEVFLGGRDRDWGVFGECLPLMNDALSGFAPPP